MLNVKMIQTGSSDVCRRRLRELVRGDVQGRPGGIVSKWIWRVLACPVRMLRIQISGDFGGVGGGRATQTSIARASNQRHGLSLDGGG